MSRIFSALAACLALTVLAACSTSPRPLALTDYAAILADPARTEADRADDAARKPAEVLAFVGVRPGETILELESGRGWYSEILSAAVGPAGRLITQSPAEAAYSAPALAVRKAAGRLPNVRETTSLFDKLDAPDASVDKVLWFLGPHDLYYKPKNSIGFGNPAASFAEIARVLRPGGEFVVLDHAANAGSPTITGATLHRIDPAVVLGLADGAGLTFVGRSDALANPEDDRAVSVMDASIRRHTDQFLFKFRK